jgi:Pycsar effector protein
MTTLTDPALSTTIDPKRTISFLESCLARHLAWITAADAKTAVIFTLVIAMVALPVATVPKYGDWTPAGVVMAVIAGLGLLSTLASLTLAIIPRTTPPAQSLIFFGTVAKRSVELYRRDVVTLNDENYVDDLIRQTHVNATIASKKYYWIRRATILLYVSLLPWMLAVFLLFKDRR